MFQLFLKITLSLVMITSEYCGGVSHMPVFPDTMPGLLVNMNDSKCLRKRQSLLYMVTCSWSNAQKILLLNTSQLQFAANSKCVVTDDTGEHMRFMPCAAHANQTIAKEYDIPEFYGQVFRMRPQGSTKCVQTSGVGTYGPMVRLTQCSACCSEYSHWRFMPGCPSTGDVIGGVTFPPDMAVLPIDERAPQRVYDGNVTTCAVWGRRYPTRTRLLVHVRRPTAPYTVRVTAPGQLCGHVEVNERVSDSVTVSPPAYSTQQVPCAPTGGSVGVCEYSCTNQYAAPLVAELCEVLYVDVLTTGPDTITICEISVI